MPEASERLGKVHKTLLRRISEHSQRTQDDKAMILSLATAIAIIHQERIRQIAPAQGNGAALACANA